MRSKRIIQIPLSALKLPEDKKGSVASTMILPEMGNAPVLFSISKPKLIEHNHLKAGYGIPQVNFQLLSTSNPKIKLTTNSEEILVKLTKNPKGLNTNCIKREVFYWRLNLY